MVNKYQKSNNPDSTLDDIELERLLKIVIAKQGTTLTQYFAEAIKQQLLRNGHSLPVGDKNRKQHPESQAHLKSTRDSIEIIRDILSLGEVGKTRVKYEVGLDHKQTERYLSFLIRGQFLERVETERRGAMYRPSEQGLQLLQKIEGVEDMLADARHKAPR